MSTFTVQVLLNVATGPDGRSINFDGYIFGQPLATTDDLELRIDADDQHQAAEIAFSIGNRVGADRLGHEWPADVRSVSVGDVVQVAVPDAPTLHLACEPRGFTPIHRPAPSEILPLVDQDSATSRTSQRRLGEWR